ncbi:MAG: hypothetical protein OIF51_20780 [Cellvibrionaceae bacterium]|nr:hypothetical protein [Cellvibrionaceae bacterium]
MTARYLLLLALLFGSLPGFADIHILVPEQSKSLEAAAEQIKTEMRSRGIAEDELSIRYGLQAPAEGFDKTDLLLALGPKAANFALQHGQQNKIVFSFVEEAFIREATEGRKVGSWAAIVINQPLQRMYALAELLLAERSNKTVLIPNSLNNALLNKQVEELSQNEALQLIHRSIEPNARNISRLEDEFYQAAMVLAPLDNELWRGKNARLLLHQAYSYQLPIVAHSRAFTKAGAMLAVYLSKEQVAKETADLVKTWQAADSFAQDAIVYPEANLEINDNIARALRYKPELIRQQLQQPEQKQKILGRQSRAR